MKVHWLSKRASRAGLGRVRRILAVLGSAVGCLLLLLSGVPPAGAATPSFGDSRFFGRSTDRVHALAVGDLDGDGDLDIAAGGPAGSAVYLNDGSGDFGPPVAVAPTDWSASIALGDMDGDGDLDIVAGNTAAFGGSQNVVYLNDGDGSFPVARNFGPGSDATEAVVVGDMDGDGDLDIAAGNKGQQGVVYLNDGDGNFNTDPEIICTAPPADARCFGSASDPTQGLAIGDMDGDDDLDLVAGNYGGQSAVYLNDGLAGFSVSHHVGPMGDPTEAVAVGDLNGDGLLDIAVGNGGAQNVAYMNDGSGTFTTTVVNCAAPPPPDASCFGTGTDATRSLVVGDMDGDGSLDIAVGNSGAQNTVYLNDGSGHFPADGAFGTGEDTTEAVTLGDLDGDGAIDVVVGNDRQQSAAYLNNASGSFAPIYTVAQTQYTEQVLVGDMDDDGDLDLFIHDDQSRVYLNDGTGEFPVARSVGAAGSPSARAANALADMDGDGDLDILTGRIVYLNDGDANFYTGAVNCAAPPPNARCFGPGTFSTRSLATGDLDGDGDLDIAVGNAGQQNLIYLNDGSSGFYTGAVNCLTPPDNASCFGTGTDATRSLAVGDLDGDGDLDLVAGNYSQMNTVHLNNGSARFDWSGTNRSFGPGIDNTQSIALGDLDGDGDLDIVVGNRGPNAVYLNDGAANFDWPGAAHNFGPGSDTTTNVTVGDVDGDGDLDILVGNSGILSYGEPNAIYMNGGSGVFDWSSPVRDLGSGSDWTNSLAVGDLNGDGTLDVAIGNAYSSDLLTSTVALNGVRRPERLPGNPPYLRVTRPGPSADGNLYSAATILADTTIPITYTLFDHEGEPIEHVEAFYSLDGGGHWLPAVAATGTITTNLAASAAGTPHLFTWDTFQSGFFGQSDNVVLRLIAYPSVGSIEETVPGPFQWPYAAAATFPFRVRGTQIRVLHDGAPAADAIVYRMAADDTVGAAIADGAGTPFRTDARGFLPGRGEVWPDDRLVAALPITWTGAYTLFYTSAAPTLTGVIPYTVTAGGVQTLTVSAENPLVLFNLRVALQWDARNDTQFLEQLYFDLQRTAALLYDWTDGQAALGAITLYHDRAHWEDADIRVYATNRMRPNAAQGGIVAEVISDTQHLTITYAPGMVHMGAVWNRYGDPGGALDEDWPRTLAHELGHYALFLDDNYLGFDAAGRLIPVSGCPGVMTDPYREDWPYDELHAASDWLPECADTLSQRVFGRADWATLELFYPALDGTLDNAGPTNLPLAVTQLTVVEPLTPCTTLEDATFYLVDEGGGMLQLGSSARAVLLRDDLLTDLGRPTLDRVLARGARVGDRLCVYELAAGRQGCETIAANDNQLKLWNQPDWQPELVLAPQDTRTLAVTVTNVAAGATLGARLYPFTGGGLEPIVLAWDGSVYHGVFSATVPIPAGYVHVWVVDADPAREALTDYVLGSNPGRMQGGMGAPSRGRSSPAVSADGQAILFGNLEFPQDEFYALQSLTRIPEPLPWATAVGRAYRLLKSPGAPDLSAASLSIAYMADDVVPGEEEWIRMYYWDGAVWTLLPTTLDTTENMAAAPCQGEGLYALMSSIEVPLQQGWNLLAYPVPQTRAVTETLLSIQGAYTLVYGYDGSVPADPWAVYGPGAPAWVSDLDTFVFGRGYWISATEAITLYLKGTGGEGSQAGFPNPPATCYGQVLSSAYFTPTPGLTVTAWVGDQLCGQALTREEGGQVVYVVSVRADDEVPGCGDPGRAVTFRVGTQPIRTQFAWDNGRLWPLDLRANAAPLAVDDTAATAEDSAVAIPVLDNDADPDGDPYALVAVTGPAHGAAAISGTAVLYTPAPDYYGQDAFTYTVGDGLLTATAAAVISVTAANDAPTAQDDAYATPEDTPLSVDVPGVLANDSDIDGDPLTAVVVAPPGHGTLVLNADGSFVYTAGLNWSGAVSFTYLLSDGELTTTAVAQLTVDAVNDAPVAAGDHYQVLSGAALVIVAPGVLGNDTDVEGDPLSAVLETPPDHGVLALNAAGSLIYLSPAGFTGVVTFTYRVDDGLDLSQPMLDTITVWPTTGWKVYLPFVYRPGGR